MTAGLIALLFSCSPAGIWQQDVRGFVDDGLSLVTMESHRLSRQGETAPLPRAIPDQPHTLRITLRNPRDFDLVVTLEVGDQGLFSAEPQLVAVDNRLLEVHFHPREDARDHQLAFRIDLRAPEIGRTFPSLEISLDCRYPDSDITVDIDLATPGSHGLVLTPNPLEAVQGQSVTVGLAGGSPLAGGSDWRWYLQGDVIAGQTGASLNLETADLLGDYNLGVSVVYEGVSYSGDAVIRVRQSDLSTCTVWYDASGGTGAPAESDHASGDTVTVGAAPSRSGYDFLGWQSDDIPPAPGGLHQPGDTFTMPPRSVWFTALWEAQEPADITVDIDLATPGSHGLVLTPNPLEAVQGQSVTVGLAGGSPLAGGSDWRWYLQGDVIAGQTGASLNLETADLLGDYNLGVSVVYEGVSYSGDAVIRVRQSDLSTCTVWYDSVGGTGAPAESDHASGDTVTVGAAPSRSGYDFLGWQSDDIPPAPGGLHQPGDTFTMPPRSVWFTALWEAQEPADITVEIDPATPGSHGLVLTPNPLEAVQGQSVTVGLAGGSPLAGGSDWRWYLQGDVIAGQTGASLNLETADLLGDYNLGVSVVYEGVSYSGDAVIRVRQSDLSTCTVWYDSVGGTGAPAESDHASGDTVTVGAAPSRSGYDFLGWQSDDIPPAPGGLHQPGDTFTMPGNHVLFRASWEPDLLPVENLQGSANHVSQTLSLTWTDPDSPALEGIQVTWGPTGGSENGSFSVAPGAGSALIAGVTEPGVYHISVRAIYEGGGEAPEQTVQIQRVDYDNYSVGVIGPAGGVIFYEHDNPASAGWRFLEAAPRGWYGPVEDPRYEWIGGGNINPLMA